MRESLLLFLLGSLLFLGERIYEQERARSGVFDLKLRLWLYDRHTILEFLPEFVRGGIPLIIVENGLLEGLIWDENVISDEFSLDALDFKDLIDSICLLLGNDFHIIAHSKHRLMRNHRR